MGDSVGEHPSFTAARSGDNQKRTIDRASGVRLLGVKQVRKIKWHSLEPFNKDGIDTHTEGDDKRYDRRWDENPKGDSQNSFFFLKT